MTQTFIFLETSSPPKFSWVFLQNGNILSSGDSDSLVELPDESKNHKTIIIVPAENTLLTEVDLPKLSRHQLVQALPFALEEYLVEDVSHLHFAVGKRETNGMMPVVVVSKEKMNEWLHLLNQLHIPPTKFIPSIFAVPHSEKAWTILVTSNQCHIRTGRYSGFTSEKQNLMSMLELHLSSALEKPEQINFLTTIKNDKPIFSFTTIPINFKLLTEDELKKEMIESVKTLSYINLLQGHYQVRRKSTKTKKVWMLASILTLACLITAFTGELVSYFILKHEYNKINTAISSVYHQQFPNMTSVVAPKERFNNKLNQLQRQNNKYSFLSLLAETTEALSDMSEIHLDNLDFRNNKLTLKLTAASFDNVDHLTTNLSKQGLVVKQQNAAALDNKVNVTLVIQRGSA